jgi:hypothetical protein
VRSGLRAIRAGKATAHEGHAAVSIHCSERRSGARTVYATFA